MKLIVLFLLLLCSLGCQQIENSIVEWRGKTMGTTYLVKFTQAPDGPMLPSQQEVDKILKAVNASMSTYIPTSEISKINREGKKNKPYSISEDFNRVLEFSMDMAERTEGVFDPTIGPLVNLWGFGPNGQRQVPSPADISNTKKRVGFQKVAHDSKQMRVMFVEDGMELDFSASAKGFGVDKIAEFLNKRRIANYMVEIGGEIRTRGTKNGKPWQIAIEVPDPDLSKKSIQKIMPLTNISAATSGSYRNFFMQDGKGYSHTINHVTGKPVPGIMASVTVLSPKNCMEADGWATALMAMGPEKGIEYTKKYSIAAYFVYASLNTSDKVSTEAFSVYESVEFKRLMTAQSSMLDR